MNRILLLIVASTALSACGKGSNNSASAPAPTKVQNESLEAIPGVWMDEKFIAAYKVANSQNSDGACGVLVKRLGDLRTMNTPSNYFQIDKDGSFQQCNTEGGVGKDGEATPIKFECLPQESKVDLSNGTLRGKNGCTLHMSANDTSGIVSGTCEGKSDVLNVARISKRGFETLITVASDCLVKANAESMR
jgi:hypothetical protein